MNEACNPTSPSENLRELDQRVFDGIEVTLYWVKDTGEGQVDVIDSKGRDDFSITTSSMEEAFDVFQHPYSYAAHPGDVAIRGYLEGTESEAA